MDGPVRLIMSSDCFAKERSMGLMFAMSTGCIVGCLDAVGRLAH